MFLSFQLFPPSPLSCSLSLSPFLLPFSLPSLASRLASEAPTSVDALSPRPLSFSLAPPLISLYILSLCRPSSYPSLPYTRVGCRTTPPVAAAPRPDASARTRRPARPAPPQRSPTLPTASSTFSEFFFRFSERGRRRRQPTGRQGRMATLGRRERRRKSLNLRVCGQMRDKKITAIDVSRTFEKDKGPIDVSRTFQNLPCTGFFRGTLFSFFLHLLLPPNQAQKSLAQLNR